MHRASPLPSAVLSVRPTAVLASALLALAGLVLGLAIAALPLEAAALLVGGGIAVVLIGLEPLAALGLLLLAVPLSSLAEIEVGDFSITAIEPLLALLLLSWLARGIARRELTLPQGPILGALGLVLLALLASSLAAQRPGLTYKEIVKWSELAVVFAFTATYLHGSARWRALLAVLFLAGAGEALYGVFQYVTGQGPAAFTVGEALRAYGHFEQPNPFAGYLATILPVSLALALRRRPLPFAVLATGAAAATATGILFSLSRGAWLGVLTALGVMLAVWGPSTRRLLLPGAAALAVLVLLTASNIIPGGWSDRLVAVLDNFGVFDVRDVEVTSENFAVVERMAHWQAGWYMFLDHPLLGVGAGNYPVAYEDYYLAGWREPLGHAHNYYLNMAAETGLPGLAALLLLLGLAFRTIGRGLAQTSADPDRRALLAGILGSFVVLAVHNLFDNLLVHGMQVQVGFLLGAAVSTASAPAGAPRAAEAHAAARSPGLQPGEAES